jgi:hypothetical protein
MIRYLHIVAVLGTSLGVFSAGVAAQSVPAASSAALADSRVAAQSPAGPLAAPPAPAAAPVGSPLEVLVHARNNVEKFFAQAANVVCSESVTQTVLGKNGKPVYREESKYDYQLIASSDSGSLRLHESRQPLKVAFRDPARTLLVTNGFASLLLIVHPDYEASYQFSPAGEETVDGRILEKIHYVPIPGASSPAALRLRGKNYPLPLSGTIWIDKETGAITRMTAAVDSSLSDLGLRGMRSDIHYALVQFHDPEEAYWMPVSATIDLETPLQHWRNVHRFTDYRRFRATIQVEMGKQP